MSLYWDVSIEIILQIVGNFWARLLILLWQHSYPLTEILNREKWPLFLPLSFSCASKSSLNFENHAPDLTNCTARSVSAPELNHRLPQQKMTHKVGVTGKASAGKCDVFKPLLLGLATDFSDPRCFSLIGENCNFLTELLILKPLVKAIQVFLIRKCPYVVIALGYLLFLLERSVKTFPYSSAVIN